MKIEHSNAGLSADLQVSAHNRSNQADAAGRGPVGAGLADKGDATDAVSLSNLSRQIGGAAPDDAARTERIEQLSSLYASGRYQVDAQQISAGIIEDALGLAALEG